jgi:hypothetical protein
MLIAIGVRSMRETPSKEYVTLMVKEELRAGPLVRRILRELLSGAKKLLDFERNYVILRILRERLDKLSTYRAIRNLDGLH